jgi:hypothetical protein
MNCQSCNTRVDYLFLTNCEQCETQVEAADGCQLPPLALEPIVETRVGWKRRLVNVVYVLASSLAGMVSGAVALYVGFAILCITILNNLPKDPNELPGATCARGMFITFVVIMTGAFLGTVGGTAFAIKKPLFKAPNH